MPKRIIAIGLIFVICGVLSILEVLAALTQSRIYLNFAVLILPVGV